MGICLKQRASFILVSPESERLPEWQLKKRTCREPVFLELEVKEWVVFLRKHHGEGEQEKQEGHDDLPRRKDMKELLGIGRGEGDEGAEGEGEEVEGREKLGLQKPSGGGGAAEPGQGGKIISRGGKVVGAEEDPTGQHKQKGNRHRDASR